MDPQALNSESCQLESRYWVITDESGKMETVNGLGVVGTYTLLVSLNFSTGMSVLNFDLQFLLGKAQNRYG